MALQDEIAAIREAIATGAKKIRFKDGATEKEVDYPSFADLRARLEYLEGLAVEPAKRTRVILAQF